MYRARPTSGAEPGIARNLGDRGPYLDHDAAARLELDRGKVALIARRGGSVDEVDDDRHTRIAAHVRRPERLTPNRKELTEREQPRRRRFDVHLARAIVRMDRV